MQPRCGWRCCWGCWRKYSSSSAQFRPQDNQQRNRRQQQATVNASLPPAPTPSAATPWQPRPSNRGPNPKPAPQLAPELPTVSSPAPAAAPTCPSYGNRSWAASNTFTRMLLSQAQQVLPMPTAVVQVASNWMRMVRTGHPAGTGLAKALELGATGAGGQQQRHAPPRHQPVAHRSSPNRASTVAPIPAPTPAPTTADPGPQQHRHQHRHRPLLELPHTSGRSSRNQLHHSGIQPSTKPAVGWIIRPETWRTSSMVRCSMLMKSIDAIS